MATTTNFGWETPDDTDLVKDGALAIRTLGSAIDTSLVDLKGGTTGQVLSKTSNTDMDFTWVTSDDANAIQNAIVDAKGDLITATAADTPARLAVGTNGHVLTADSTTATGLKWAAASSGGMTLISTTTLSGASVTLSSIPQTYNQLKIYVWNVTNNTADGRLTFKPNASTNFRWSGTDFNAVYNSGSSVIQPNANMSRTNGDNGFCLTIDNYTSAAYYYVWHLDGYYYDGGNPRGINIAGSGADGTITSFVLANTGGTFAGGTMQLYGVK